MHCKPDLPLDYPTAKYRLKWIREKREAIGGNRTKSSPSVRSPGGTAAFCKNMSHPMIAFWWGNVAGSGLCNMCVTGLHVTTSCACALYNVQYAGYHGSKRK